MNPYKTIVALTADLIFGARVRSATTDDVRVILGKSVKDFLTQVAEHKPDLAILDLDRRGLDVADVVRQVKQQNVELLVYVSHVRADLIEEARAAGADRVMARGAFAKQLPEILRG